MWITQLAYLETQKALIQAIAERDAIRQQQAALTATNDWLMSRVTQLEYERAAMIKVNYGVEVTVPTIQKVPDNVGNLNLNTSFSFGDMGDEEAAKQGVSWDEDGRLTYSVKQ